MEIKGKIVKIGQTEKVSETFSKRDLIVDVSDNPTYPSPVKFEALKDKTALLDNLKVGDNVEISFNMNGREWSDKTGKVAYFTTLSIWKISKTDGSVSQPKPANVSSAPDDDSDLPF
jgi:hypothetical protein